jgi:hypothetical protein
MANSLAWCPPTPTEPVKERPPLFLFLNFNLSKNNQEFFLFVIHLDSF